MSYVISVRPSWHYPRPSLLEDAIKRCPNLIKSKPFLDIIGKVTERQLKALVSVSQALLHYTDVITLQYGMWDKVRGLFKRFDLKLVRKYTRLSNFAIYQSINLLKQGGFLEVKKVWEKVLPGFIKKTHPDYKKAFKSKPAIRKLTQTFFYALGISKERLEMNQSCAKRKQEERVRKEVYRKELQKSSIWSKMPFYVAAEPLRRDERKHTIKTSLSFLANLKSILNRSANACC